jgi:hypothetical protein
LMSFQGISPLLARSFPYFMGFDPYLFRIMVFFPVQILILGSIKGTTQGVRLGISDRSSVLTLHHSLRVLSRLIWVLVKFKPLSCLLLVDFSRRDLVRIRWLPTHRSQRWLHTLSCRAEFFSLRVFLIFRVIRCLRLLERETNWHLTCDRSLLYLGNVDDLVIRGG